MNQPSVSISQLVDAVGSRLPRGPLTSGFDTPWDHVVKSETILLRVKCSEQHARSLVGLASYQTGRQSSRVEDRMVVPGI